VVMHELADPAADGVAEVTSAVRSAVVADHGISPETVVLLEPGALPRTGSGKVRRGPSRTAFEESDLARVITIDSRKAEASIGTDAG
jgi:acyl-coenzyme A synthetase/AMP-(fatty) acid ligase